MSTKKSTKSLAFLESLSNKKLTISSLLWSIREAEELTQVQFAEKLDITRQYVCDLEHGRRNITPKLAAKFAKKLGYSEEQFVRLALQDQLDKAGLPFEIDLKKAA